MATARFMIIDGNALVHRAFHALPPLSDKDGKLVNAVYGFTTVLMKALKELKPEYAAVTFDLPGGTFRDALYAEYKAQRVKQPQELYDQLPWVKEVVRAFGIPVVEKPGFEADDVIATLVQKSVVSSQKPGVENVIVTGDMDTLQLVDAYTKVYSFRKGFSDTFIYDEQAVRERYGLNPNQMVDYKALRGDPSDNIPGVRGIGEKTATTLLQEFGTLEKLYAAIGKSVVSSQKSGLSERVVELLVEHKKDALLGKKLVQLVRDVPIGVTLADCKIPAQDNEKLREAFERFGFKNLIARLDKENVVVPTAGGTQKAQGTLLSEVVGKENVVRPFKVADGEAKASHYSVTDKGTWGHDLKVLMRSCHLSPVTCHLPLFDTMIASYLLSPGSRMHDFDQVVREHNAGADTTEDTLKNLVAKLKSKLEQEGLWRVFSEIEMPLIPVLAEMEKAGIKVDAAHLKKLSHEFARELEALTKKIHALAGEEFNIASPVQLREVLFEKMKLAPEVGRIKKTAKGGVASTAAGQLEKLRGLHPIVDLIFDYRELAKLQSTYTDALIALVDKKDLRVHTTFNQAVTATGRLSSSEPNLQNIPIRSEMGREIRKAFVSEKGCVFLSADYSQIELRVAASLSGDPEMIKAFQSGHDFHAATAALVFDVAEDKVAPEMRRKAKAINFGIIYGMGASSLAQATGTSREEAGRFMETYFEVFHVLRDYLEGLKEQARTRGYVETLFGRRRYLPEINSGVQQVRAAAERMAINMPVQGTAADLMKMAMIKLHEWIHNPTSPPLNLRGGWEGLSIRMLLQVHDELVFEVKQDLVAEVAPRIKATMEKVHTLKVPIKVDLKQGKNWGEMVGLGT